MLFIAFISSGSIRAAGISSKKRQHAKWAAPAPSLLPLGKLVVKKRGGGGGSSKKATPSGMQMCGSAIARPAASGSEGAAHKISGAP